MSGLYEFTVEWPSTSAQSVIVTGDFDQWSQSLSLSRSPSSNVFTTTIRVPYGCPTRYKFVVDGEWLVRQDLPTEYSPEGYLNNVHYVPVKEPLEVLPTKANNENERAQNETAGQLISDLADTIAARDGTSGALEYVTSGMGKTIQIVVGVDPINSLQIALPTPITPQSSTGLPSPAPNGAPAAAITSIPAATAANPESEANESIVAPIIPITIVPVYAKENCTIDPSKVISDAEAIGTFVGIGKPVKEEVEEEAKAEATEEPTVAPEAPVIVTPAPALDEEPAIVEVPKEEPVAPPEVKPEPTPAEEPKKAGEGTASSSDPAPAENSHTRSNSGASATLPSSSRPTTPTQISSVSSATRAASPPKLGTVRKSKIFPSLGNGSPKNKGKEGADADEFGAKEGRGTTGSGKKKRTSSIFGKLKHLLHLDEKEKEKKEAH